MVGAMDTATDTSNLEFVARQLRTPVEQVRATVELLDEGNTVPFITRFRKDQAGGLRLELDQGKTINQQPDAD